MEEYTVEIYKRSDGKFGWKLIHSSGNIVANDANQGYENRQDCIDVANNIGGATWGISE